MIKKTITYFLILVFITGNSGCSGELRKKFVRKKTEKKASPVLQPQEYETQFTFQQRYVNHFVFWKNAEDELIKILDSVQKNEINYKKLKFYASHSLNELNEMAVLLVDEKKQQLYEYISELADIVDKIHQGSYAETNSNLLVRKLKPHFRQVARDFSFSKMKPYIRD